MTAYKFVTTTTFDKEFKKLDKSVQKIIAKYIKSNLINSTNPFLKGKALTANLKGIWRYRIMNYRLLIEIKEDKFIPLGSDEEDNTLPNELCYVDDEGAICRCFNWRDGARTMIKDETKNSFLIMELLDNRLEELNLALDYISENAKKYLNADIEKYILDINNPEITLK